jgi:hypothetical protein
MADNVRRDSNDGPGERWLTLYEVAGRVLARPDSVRAWVRDGLLPAEDRGRLGLRVPESAVDAFLTQHLRAEGFRSADHSFSSGVGTGVLTATEMPEQAVERQGAGWPFRRDGDEAVSS